MTQPEKEATYRRAHGDEYETCSADDARIDELRHMGNTALAYALERKRDEDPHAKWSMDVIADESDQLKLILFPKNPDYDPHKVRSAHPNVSRRDRIKYLFNQAFWGGQ